MPESRSFAARLASIRAFISNPSRGISELFGLCTIPNLPSSTSSTDAALIHLTGAIQAMKLLLWDKLRAAIQALKEMGVIDVAQAAMQWVRLHPWETAAIVIPLVLVSCTPVILPALGFTASGVAAGSIAAAIQASIGNVVAGSLFAFLTSAGMGGFGFPILMGSVWGISSLVCWGYAAWKKWRKGPDDDDNGEVGSEERSRLIEG